LGAQTQRLSEFAIEAFSRTLFEHS
jgi:hypothetical protein